MTYSVEYIVNTGQFEHVLWKVTGETPGELELNLSCVHASLLEKMGQIGALSKGAVSYGYANPDSVQSGEVDTAQADAMELIKSELGGKVLGVTQKAPEDKPDPAAQPALAEPSEAPSRPWPARPGAKPQKPKEWEAEKPAAKPAATAPAPDLDNFFD